MNKTHTRPDLEKKKQLINNKTVLKVFETHPKELSWKTWRKILV
jgi:hypothetical protein